VFRTTDNGGTWSACGAIPHTNPVLGLAIDQHDHLFASVYGRGVACSMDNGATWRMNNAGLTNMALRGIMVDKQNIVWVATEGGLFCSTNEGESWTNKNPGPFGAVFQDSTGAILTGDDYTLYRSTDGGSSWTSTPLKTCLLAGVYPDGSYYGYTHSAQFFRSTDLGATWTDLHSPVAWGGYTAMMAFTRGGDVYFTKNGDGAGVVRSTNNGAGWEVMNNGLTTLRVTCIYPLPGGHIFLGTGFAGVFRSSQPAMPQNISVSLPTSATAAGSTLEVPVNVTNLSGRGICAYEFTLAFNTPDSVLVFNAMPVTTGTLSGANNWSVLVNNTVPGQVTVGAYGTTPLSGQGTLVKLTVHTLSTAAAGDSSNLMLTRFLFNAGNPAAAIQNGSVTIHERVCGDADENGLVRAYDAALTLREALGPMSSPPAPLTGMGRLNADVNWDGKVQAFDAALILRHAIGLPMPDSTGTCFGTKGPSGPIEGLALSARILDRAQAPDRSVIRVQLTGIPAGMQVLSCSFELTALVTDDDTVSVTLPQLPQSCLATVNRIRNGHFKVGIISPYAVNVESIPISITAGHAAPLGDISISEIFINDAPNAQINLKNIATEAGSPASKSVQPVLPK